MDGCNNHRHISSLLQEHDPSKQHDDTISSSSVRITGQPNPTPHIDSRQSSWFARIQQQLPRIHSPTPHVSHPPPPHPPPPHLLAPPHRTAAPAPASHRTIGPKVVVAFAASGTLNRILTLTYNHRTAQPRRHKRTSSMNLIRMVHLYIFSSGQL
ncbi:hypothetical protein JDV02_009737 [Purpureocillium takamizusanense]|uniref:Uncharacterized protein n=1 Tax=Purpureocillium takamizusanense TaxID=2060973 RepID=A0A9Q8QQD4_9HYPO|nr:uncharacterized protein JDV02_009737 [Purpureocillium takamizusanense]UNI23950.1 hypothetical protein JDV02_009737 [Purpureocillium takamizusanense]